MTETPLVSVIMIFKDAQPFLHQAARSVLAQTWSALELLLVDDGGTDGSDAVAEELARENPARVRLLAHHQRANRGMSAARALGIDAARGEFVAFLDGDDMWERGHLEHEVRLLLASRGADMVCGRALVWRSWAGPELQDGLTPLPAAPGVVVLAPRLLTAVLSNPEVRTPICSLLVRNSLLRESGGPVQAFRGMYEDQVLLARLQVRAAGVVSGATTARYRQHPASATMIARRVESRGDRSASRRTYLEWLRSAPELAPARADPELAAALERAGRAAAPAASPRLPQRVLSTVRRRLPPRVERLVREAARPAGVGRVRFGSLARTEPLGRTGGAFRGRLVDETYIDAFLQRWSTDVRGRVLEVGAYGATRFAFGSGLPQLVEVESEDLVAHARASEASYDCVLAPQVLQRYERPRAAVQALHSMLRPGGALLLTVPGIGPATLAGRPVNWVATGASLTQLLQSFFAPDEVDVDVRGNVLAGIAVLHGLAADEIGCDRLAKQDPDYPVIVTARALRSAEPSHLRDLKRES